MGCGGKSLPENKKKRPKALLIISQEVVNAEAKARSEKTDSLEPAWQYRPER